MNDKPQIKLSETVVLIDAAFLNFVITDMKGYFEETLRRSLQDIDLSMLTTYLTLDAGITEGKNEVQFLFVYDEESHNAQQKNLFVILSDFHNGQGGAGHLRGETLYHLLVRMVAGGQIKRRFAQLDGRDEEKTQEHSRHGNDRA